MADIEKHINHEDDSPQAASSTSSADFTHINEKSLLRKLDWRLLPGVSLLYLVSFLDRSNVANARLDGLVKDLNMTGNEYLTGLTVFFVGYISLEVVWNLILKRIGPRIWLPSVTIVWGIVTTLQGILVNKVGFFVIRTALGVAEGALFPGVSGLRWVPWCVRTLANDLTSRSYSICPCGIKEKREHTEWRCSSVPQVWQEPLVASWHMVLAT
jgi:hypothetical protein